METAKNQVHAEIKAQIENREKVNAETARIKEILNQIHDYVWELEDENKNLRHAAKLIAARKTMVSGSLEMAECDEYCKKLGLRPWDREWYA